MPPNHSNWKNGFILVLSLEVYNEFVNQYFLDLRAKQTKKNVSERLDSKNLLFGTCSFFRKMIERGQNNQN